MKVGDEVTITHPAIVTESHIDYVGKEGSYGWCRITPEVKANGHVLGFHRGWFFSHWIVGLNSGQIVQVPA
jgi:hypothetical protein